MIDTPDTPASILIVTGDAVLREGAAELLAAEGDPVTTAADATEGLEAMRSRAADVVLIDTDAAGADDGLGLMRSVAGGHPRTVIVAVTRFSALEPAMEALRIGAFDYLPKPFTRSQLRAVMAQAAANSREDPRTRPRHAPTEAGRF